MAFMKIGDGRLSL